MRKLFFGGSFRAIGILTLALGFCLTAVPRVNAADHGDAPIAGNNQSTDIADVFAFLDPNDNSRLVLALTQRGFIAAGENANFGIFDQFLQYRFLLETTGDAEPDQFINITFTAPAGSGGPQTATIKLSGDRSFSAPTTQSSTAPAAPTQVVTTDSATGISFFAGLVDDPFFFDIPAFGRFVASVRAGAPDATQLQRGRDSFRWVQHYGDRTQYSLVVPAKSQLHWRKRGHPAQRGDARSQRRVRHLGEIPPG